MLRVYLYLFIGWLVITVCGFMLRRGTTRRYVLRFSYVLSIMFCVELGCVLALYVKNHRWTFDDSRDYMAQLFAPHPYLGVAPRRNTHVTYRGISYTHNAQGFRGKDFPPRSDKIRIITMGGSTTYGAGVSDEQTWPVHLESLLGDQYEVLNFGVLGYSTVEHISQAALLMPEYRPDILVIHAGLNDLQNMHVKNLAPDYSDFHASSIYSSTGQCSNSPAQMFASGKVAIWLLRGAGLYPACVFDRLEPQADASPASEEYAARLYRRNLETLVAIARQQGLKPILVPQVLVREKFAGGQLHWWIPHVADESLLAYMALYNGIMEDVAEKEGLYYAREVLEQRWTKDDFVDPSHLNDTGNRRFAGLLGPIILHIKQAEDPSRNGSSTEK